MNLPKKMCNVETKCVCVLASAVPAGGRGNIAGCNRQTGNESKYLKLLTNILNSRGYPENFPMLSAYGQRSLVYDIE